MKKRLLSLLLILCLCAALLPAMVLAEDNVTIVTTEDQLKEAIEEGGAIQLGKEITLNATLVTKNNTVILDLNGNVLREIAHIWRDPCDRLQCQPDADGQQQG